jgi:hypothetical protein
MKPPKKTGIFMTASAQNNVIINGSFKNLDVGIEAAPGVAYTAINNTFQNVREPFRSPHASKMDVRGTRISDDPKLRGDRRGGSRTGWRKLSGPPLPVQCGQCGAIFPSANYPYAGAYFNSWNNEETCPDCGNEHAKVSEGIFDLSGEFIRVIEAPEITHDLIRAIAQVGNDYLIHKINADEAVDLFQKISPKLGILANKARNNGLAALAVIASLASIGGYILAREQTALAREQTALAHEQTQIAREGLRLQKEGPPPLTRDQMLELLGQRRFTSDGNSHQVQHDVKHDRGKKPTTDKPPSTSGSVDLHRKRKPKSREIRRKTRQERRQAFCGR